MTIGRSVGAGGGSVVPAISSHYALHFARWNAYSFLNLRKDSPQFISFLKTECLVLRPYSDILPPLRNGDYFKKDCSGTLFTQFFQRLFVLSVYLVERVVYGSFALLLFTRCTADQTYGIG